MNLDLLKEFCCLFSLRAIFCKMVLFSAYKVDFGSLSSKLLFLEESLFLFSEKPFLWFCMVFLFQRILPKGASLFYRTITTFFMEFYLQIFPLVAILEFIVNLLHF